MANSLQTMLNRIPDCYSNSSSALTAKRLAAYFRTEPSVIAVYIFGSHASGTPRPDSDIDLAILFTHQGLTDAQHICERVMVDLGRSTRRVVHPIILNTASEALLCQILQKGHCVYTADTNTHLEFRMRSIAMIADFGFYRKPLQAGFIKSIIENRYG